MYHSAIMSGLMLRETAFFFDQDYFGCFVAPHDFHRCGKADNPSANDAVRIDHETSQWSDQSTETRRQS
ncbi:hypothetical protein CEV31_3559 [Brucella thiophenivorans]|uniref:Uncharacterized protein n=1 Tax=Brucella thiophenivorans TaxID=571255 RepID=A0A256FCI9_9HYPH|nr:hypothetical protein CEV31_3559 [Brucella thiophenivorans]